MYDKVFENEDVVIFNVDLNTIMTLQCGCNIHLHALMLFIGIQVKNGEEVMCPKHKTAHDFSDDATMKHYAETYLDHVLSESDLLFMSFPPDV